MSRLIRIAAILLQLVTAEVLEAIAARDLASLFVSSERLHSFADLVVEDLVTVQDGKPLLTPLAERSIAAFLEDEPDTQTNPTTKEDGTTPSDDGNK